jgi:serine/threonine protein phosphatase PrpC
MFDKIIASDVASSGGIGCDNMTCVIVQFKWDIHRPVVK